MVSSDFNGTTHRFSPEISAFGSLVVIGFVDLANGDVIVKTVNASGTVVNSATIAASISSDESVFGVYKKRV